MAEPLRESVNCLQAFPSFDWGSIDATPEHCDSFGVATVLHRGLRYVRRKNGDSIWFSRTTDRKDSAGNTIHKRIVTFKESADA